MHAAIKRYRQERDDALAALEKTRDALIACTSYETRVMHALGVIQGAGVSFSGETYAHGAQRVGGSQISSETDPLCYAEGDAW